MSRKAISIKVQKKLLLLSGNTCCFPECLEKLYNRKEDVLIGEFCHINAVNELGARYDDSLPPDEIDAYDNLIMMCPTHHKIIDTNRVKYTSNVLKEIKKEHELRYNGQIEGSETTVAALDMEISKELSDIETAFCKKESLSLPVKKDYPKVPNYIPRTYTSNYGNEDLSSPYSLKDILLKHDRITILGIAGTGKSAELENLAHQYSNTLEDLFPIKIRLNLVTQQYPILYYLKLEYPLIEQIPQEQVLILLDALDEVHSDHIEFVANNIALLGKELAKAKIVVSARNNFYTVENAKRAATIESFKTFLLNPLGQEDIQLYIHTHCSNENDFYEKIDASRIFDLLFSPFYLVNLIENYNKSHSIPKSKQEIFEYLIRERFEADVNKFQNTGIQIRSNQNKIESQLETLAFTAQCLGRNYLNGKDEFYKIVPSERMLKILKRAYLFNTTQDDKWMFEHNNFQEYLAAKYLSKSDFSLIQDIVSFTGHKKIKPSWVNTLSFLFSILDTEDPLFKNLLDWINQIEPDILIRFEKDKIQLKVRESIFFKIYADFINKGIRIENENFRGIDLAKFVSDSEKVLKFLIDAAKPDTNAVTLDDKIRLLLYFDNVVNFKQEISQLLVGKVCDNAVSNLIKYRCLRELGTLNISSNEITKTLLDTGLFKSSKHFRAGFFSYILNSDEIENHIVLYLEGIEHVRSLERVISGNNDGEPDFSDEKYTLESVLKAINRKDNIAVLLSFFDNYDGYSNFYHDIIKHLLTKATEIFKAGAHDIFPVVLKSLIGASKRHDRHINKNYREFFIETGTSEAAFDELYKAFESGKEPAFEVLCSIAIIATDDIIDRLIKDAENHILTENQIFQIRGILGYNGDMALHNKFYDAILKLDPKYKYEENVYEKRKEERAKRDGELIFNRDTFLGEIKSLFDKEQKDEFTREELYDYRNANFNNLDNELSIQTIRRWSKATESISLKEVTERINDDNKWLWFQLHTLINWDIHNKDFEYTTTQTDFLKQWVRESVKTANFHKAIETIPGSRYHYTYTELYIVYLSERLEIEMSEQTYLDFLHVDCELIPYKTGTEIKREDRLISDFVLSKVDFNLVKERIFENLKNSEIYRGVRHSYFRFLIKHLVKESIDVVFNELTLDKLSIYERKSLVAFYITLKGDLVRLECILDKVEDELKVYITDKLVENKSPNIEAVCKTEYNKSIDTDKELTYINFLMHINTTTYFKYLKNWIMKNKRIPEIGFDKFSVENYPELVELYEDCLKNNYGNEYSGNNKGAYLGQILDIVSKTELLYKQTLEKLLLWIKTYPNSEYLHYQIQKLDQLYYSNRPQALTFSEVNAILLGNNKKKGNRLIQFYTKNKTVIDLVGIILTTIGAILAVISMF